MRQACKTSRLSRLCGLAGRVCYLKGNQKIIKDQRRLPLLLLLDEELFPELLEGELLLPPELLEGDTEGELLLLGEDDTPLLLEGER